MIYDVIVTPPRRTPVPGWARVARGPGGVVSDEQGRVLVNLLQQDLDRVPDPSEPIPAGVGPLITEWPKG